MEVELTTDELCTLMGSLEAKKLALDDLFNPVLNMALVSLIELKIAVSILWLTSISSRMAPKRRHLV